LRKKLYGLKQVTSIEKRDGAKNMKPVDKAIAPEETSERVKEEWVTPAVTDYKAVTITQGLSYRIGDGISNLS
jgi:hypothetical protein